MLTLTLKQFNQMIGDGIFKNKVALRLYTVVCVPR